MKNTLKLLPFAAMAFLTAACTKAEMDSSESETKYITFSAGMDMGTRALLHSLPSNVSLTLYGIESTPNSPTGAPSGTPDTVISGKTLTPPKSSNPTQGGAAVVARQSWSIEDTDDNEGKYPWNEGMDYTFYAWLGGDGTTSASDFFDDGAGNGLELSEGKLKVPAKKLGLNADNLDFCYSKVVSRDAAISDFSTVYLELNHMFASFSISAYSGSDLTIKSVKLYGIHDGKGAEVNYNGDAAVEYGTGSVMETNSGDGYVELLGGDVDLTAYVEVANIIGTAGAHADFLVWPQTAADLACTGYTNPTTPPTGGAYLSITYNNGSDKTVYLELPQNATGWPAGVSQNMQLVFDAGLVTLVVTPSPWNLVEEDIDLKEAISVTDGKLSLTPKATSDPTCRDVIADGGTVTGTFTVDTPVGATWLISVTNPEAFDVFGSNNSSNPAYGTVNGSLQTFTIKPKAGVDRSKIQKTKLIISLKLADGTIVSIDKQLGNVDEGSDEAWNIILNPIK